MSFEIDFKTTGLAQMGREVAGARKEASGYLSVLKEIRSEVRALDRERVKAMQSGGGRGGSGSGGARTASGSYDPRPGSSHNPIIGPVHGPRGGRSDDELLSGAMQAFNLGLSNSKQDYSERKRADRDSQKKDDVGSRAVQGLLQKAGLGGSASQTLAPLLSSLAPAVGALAVMAAPFMAAAVGILGIGAVGVGIANSAADTSRNVGGAGRYGGGSQRESEQLTGVGSFLGMSGDQVGQFAESFGSALQKGGYGAGYFRSQGVVDTGIYTIDKSKNLLAAVDILRDIKSDSQAELVARTTGTQELLKFRNLSDDTFGSLKDSLSGAGSPANQKAGAEYDAQKAILSNEWDRTVQTLGKDLLPGLSSLVRGLNWVLGANSGASAGGTNSMTDAAKNINQASRALKDSADQVGRFKNPVPKAWHHQQTEEAMMRGYAQRQGDFST